MPDYTETHFAAHLVQGCAVFSICNIGAIQGFIIEHQLLWKIPK